MAVVNAIMRLMCLWTRDGLDFHSQMGLNEVLVHRRGNTAMICEDRNKATVVAGDDHYHYSMHPVHRSRGYGRVGSFNWTRFWAQSCLLLKVG